MPTVVEPASTQRDKRLVSVPQPDDTLSRPMSFELASGGRLMATGTITPGSSQVLLRRLKSAVTTSRRLFLTRPVDPSQTPLRSGVIRKRNFATRVEAGRYCASACPLVFAGGVERRVEPKAVIGVHQIAAVKSAAGGPSPTR